jgi:hypothetical protein
VALRDRISATAARTSSGVGRSPGLSSSATCAHDDEVGAGLGPGGGVGAARAGSGALVRSDRSVSRLEGTSTSAAMPTTTEPWSRTLMPWRAASTPVT